MTIIAAVAFPDGTIQMACDSATTVGNTVSHRPSAYPKMWKWGPMALGVSGSPRVEQALRFGPEWNPGTEDPLRDIVNIFVPRFKEILKEEKEASLDPDNAADDISSRVLIGVDGRLFTVYTDGGVVETRWDFAAIGSGAPEAMAVLWSTRGLDPHNRLVDAMHTACALNNDCEAPITFLTLQSRGPRVEG